MVNESVETKSQSRRVASEHRARLRDVLREWRGLRRVSQLALAVNAEISQRHLSFIESGRAQPSREMILKIAEALDMPLRARNDLLVAAGFAPFYPERPLDSREMDRAREALTRILLHHEPYPSMILDRSWNIVMSNNASKRIIARCIDMPAPAQLPATVTSNFMRLMFHPGGIRPRIRSWDRTAPILIARLRREAASYPGAPGESSPSAALLRELLPGAPNAFIPGLDDAPLAPTVPLELDVDGSMLRLFNTLTTFGTPQDVTLQELRIEMSFPADEESDALLRDWAAPASPTKKSSTRRR